MVTRHKLGPRRIRTSPASSSSSAFVSARSDGFSIPAAATSARTTSSADAALVGRPAEDDRVRVAEDAEQRPAAATVLVGALDQPRDLDELHEHAADPRQRGHGAQRREGVVARLDLDVRERLQERRLAGVRRPRRARPAPRPRAAPGASRGGRPSRACVCARARPRATCAGRRTGRSGSRAAPRAGHGSSRPAPSPPCRRGGASPPVRTCDAASASRSSFRLCGKEHARCDPTGRGARHRPASPDA